MTQPVSHTSHHSRVTVWTGETGTSTGTFVGPFADITVQATGTGTVTIQGQNLTEDVNAWVPLHDLYGNAISLAAGSNDMAVVLEHPNRIRCVVVGGTATVVMAQSGNR